MDVEEVITDNNINEYIEQKIEEKFNKVIDNLVINNNNNNEKKIYEYTIHELYVNTIQYIIDVINDLGSFFQINHKNTDNNEYRNKLLDIFFNNDRKLYSGIVLIFLSIILYFIDGIST
tara:strand:- start:543 stop:899 length:357 start_codon:yes stop_codon:yes gene_type:complete